MFHHHFFADREIFANTCSHKQYHENGAQYHDCNAGEPHKPFKRPSGLLHSSPGED